MIYHESSRLDHVFVILRFDADMVAEFGMRVDFIHVKKVVRSEEVASREVDRLNRINGDKGAIYFWRSARLDRDLRIGDDAGFIEAEPIEDVRANHKA